MATSTRANPEAEVQHTEHPPIAPTQARPQPGQSKKAYIQMLNLKRLGYLERAEMCEELIQELGGDIENIDLSLINGEKQRTRDDDREEEFEVQSRRDSGSRSRSSSRSTEETDEEGDNQNNSPEATRKDGGPDHRFSGNETEAITESRSRGNDGRGQVTDPENDKRLKGNETEALSKARHMEGGDDGRGEVTDPENDKRLKENLGKRSEAASGGTTGGKRKSGGDK